MTQTIDRISKWDILRFSDIARVLEDLHRGSGSRGIYFIQVDEHKRNAMFLCKAHLNIIVWSDMRYDCTSQT